MFDIGWSEFVVIGVVALIAIGPKELPAVLRTMGQYMGKIRRMAADFQSQFHEAMREAEMADLKKEVDDLTNQAQNLVNYDPLSDTTKSATPVAETPAASPDAPVNAAASDSAAAAPISATSDTAPAVHASVAPVDVNVPLPEPPPPPSAEDFAAPPAQPAKPGGDRAA